MNKTQLRHLYKQKRLALSSSQRQKRDDLLLIQFQRLALPDNLQTLLTYWPLEKQAEVNTDLCTRYLLHIIPHLQVAYPVVDAVTQEMNVALADDETIFAENIYGIPEPIMDDNNKVLPEEIDMVLVPLFAFDTYGFRVGYGKGYYDQFLPHCRTDVCKVGFSYFDAIDKIDDTHQFDVPLNYCITPERIYEF